MPRRGEMRSRNGCVHCRKRRRKCSEDRPQCKSCAERGVACHYDTRLQWVNVATQATRAPSRRAPRPTPPPTLIVDEDDDGDDGNNILHDEVGDDVERDEAVASLFQLSSGMPLITNATLLFPQDDDSGANQWSPINWPADRQEMTTPLTMDVAVSVSEEWEFNDSEVLSRVSPDAFSTPGERTAFAYWFNHLARVLPAHDAEANPYRSLSALTLGSPILLDTIVSLATEYMHCDDKATASLRRALVAYQPSSSTSMASNARSLGPQQATLAAVLLQVANVVFMGGSGVETHLTCAMFFLQELGYVSSPVDPDDAVARVLVQRYAMLDVTLAVLRRRRPRLPPGFWLFRPDETTWDRTAPSFRAMTGCPQPVLGFLSRAAHLAADLAEGKKRSGGNGDGAHADEYDDDGDDDDDDDDYAVLRRASTLETDMRIYARSRVCFSTTRAPRTRHLDTLSQLFYWSAHLVLQRQVYRDAPSSPRVRHTVQDMVLLMASMPLGCGPDSSLAFPFYLSSREATTEPHRAWVRRRNAELKKVYPARARDASMALLEDIWAAVAESGLAGGGDEASSRALDAVVQNLEQSRDFCLF